MKLLIPFLFIAQTSLSASSYECMEITNYCVDEELENCEDGIKAFQVFKDVCETDSLNCNENNEVEKFKNIDSTFFSYSTHPDALKLCNRELLQISIQELKFQKNAFALKGENTPPECDPLFPETCRENVKPKPPASQPKQ